MSAEGPDRGLVTIARVGAPHGVFGQLKLHLFLDDPNTIYDFKSTFMKLPNEKQFKPFQAFVISEKGHQFYIQFPPITDRDQARIYTHAELAVERNALPALSEGEFYWDDLVGCEVINQAGINFGVVMSFLETGAHDVMVLKNEAGKEVLIPYVMPNIVTQVDVVRRIIEVNWEGL